MDPLNTDPQSLFAMLFGGLLMLIGVVGLISSLANALEEWTKKL